LDYLRQKAMLLIMDSFEHLLAGPEPGRGDGAGLVADVLQTAPDVKILTTSRARLNVQGECLFHLAGMDFPEPLPAAEAETPEDALHYSAVKLFLQSARRVKPGFELAADDLKYVARICRLVGGMPLGILLAAGWLEMLTPGEIADEIEASLDFLETDLRDVPERQRSMRAVFDHSWNLLTERQRSVIRALSVFRGGFTRVAAQEVTGASLRELRALVDKSLLQRDPAGRYGIHELLRQYAEEKLGRAGAKEEVSRAHHSAYYAGFLQQRESQLIGSDKKKTIAEIGVEIENVRAAWDWAVAHGEIEDINCALRSLAEFYHSRAWYQQGEEAFSRAAQGLTGSQNVIASSESRMVLGRVLLQLGRFCNSLGRIERGRGVLKDSLAMFRDLDARREMAYALCYLGGVAPTQTEGESLYQKGLAVFREVGDRRGIALSLRGLGWTAIFRGEYRAAKQLFEESLGIFRQLGNQEGIATSLDDLGYTAWVLGEYELAKQLHQEGLALYRQLSDQRGIADCADFLAIAAAGLGEYEEAKQLWLESLALFEEIGHPYGMAWALVNRGEVANLLEEYTEAIRLAQKGLALFKRIDYRRGIAHSIRVLGDAACGLGDLQGAKRHFCQALEAAMTLQVMPFTLHTLIGIATLLAAEGDREQALELLVLVLHHPISWQWVRDRAARVVVRLEAELSPDIVASARERGRVRDLGATVAELLDELGETSTDSLDQPAGIS
jgi:predicted ATPase